VDCLEDSVGFGEDGVVPEAEDVNSAGGEETSADFVVGAGFIGVVLAAVEFHDQTALHADEVDNVASEWVLASEF